MNDSNDEVSINQLPEIQHEPVFDELDINYQLSQKINYIEQTQEMNISQNNGNISDDTNNINKSNINEDEIDEGQKTPVARSINVIQNKLNNALRMLSPEEKLKQERTKANVKLQKQQIAKALKNNTSSENTNTTSSNSQYQNHENSPTAHLK